MLTRRAVLQYMAGAALGGVADWPLLAQQQEIGPLVATFKSSYRVPALSIAISRNGQFVFDRGFGFDQNFQVGNAKDLGPVNMSSLFRIASLSKPVTAVAIFTLIEQGRLRLTDRVFGASGVLSTKYGQTFKQYVTDITLDHLLTHTSGGWPDGATNPMLRPDGWDQTKLISWTIENLALTSPPGEKWAYSSFGYCLLGRVIEQVTGQPYADYVQSAVLAPCGITGMRIAGNTLRQRAQNEVVYFGQYNEDPYKMNTARMDATDGWLATPSAMVQFLNHVGGSGPIASILKPGTIQAMLTPCPVFPGYARGWMMSGGNCYHNGSLPGSTTLMVRTASGMCWAALANTRTEPHDEIDNALDGLMWNVVRSRPAWKGGQ